eukprot:TRINITY_DN26059_c0_g1_i1.p1 TRINITY_DN26059_c0_g1~~TRINITY_DN26059_c0_g1_i1.p1  ORF type:complete len:455 (-),score=97.22 TRINITY_DN26059_c0_g1_i1:119-1483(-)
MLSGGVREVRAGSVRRPWPTYMLYTLGALLFAALMLSMALLYASSTVLEGVSPLRDPSPALHSTDIAPSPPRPYLPARTPVWYNDPLLVTDLRDPLPVDQEWLPVMRNARITAIEWFHAGLSTKYRAHLEGGYQVSIKPALPEDDLADDEDFETLRWSTVEKKHSHPYVTRARREVQGATEVSAFHADRVLCLHRKPPIAGRLIPNEVFYRFNASEQESERRNMPPYNIPVGIIPWVDGLHHTTVTKQVYGEALLMEAPMPSREDKYDLTLDISDTLVFDFLIDDHDRFKSQNWEHGAMLPLLIWDSGLGWVHGPRGYSEEKEAALLCGPSLWREDPDGKDYSCPKICRFSSLIVKRVRQLVSTPGGFANAMREHMQDEPLFPMFNNSVYLVDRSKHPQDAPYVLLESDEFYDGMDIKAHRFLAIVDECIAEHGEEEVLLEYKNPRASRVKCVG